MRVFTALVVIAALASCAKPPEAGAPEGKAVSCAQDGKVSITNAWVRAQPDSEGMSAAYFALCNGTPDPVTLAGATSPAAAMAQIHATVRDDSGATSMQPAGEITLAPGETVQFEPGGRHIMLMGLAGPIESGADVELTIALAGGAAVTAIAEAKSPVEAAREGD